MIVTLVMDVLGTKKRSVVVGSWLSFVFSASSHGVCSLLSAPVDSVSTTSGSVLSKDASALEFSVNSLRVRSSVLRLPVVDSWVIFSASFLSAPGPLSVFP